MIERLWDWLFPVGCPGCGGSSARGFCPACRSPLSDLLLPLDGRQVLTCGTYAGPLRRAILALKMQGYHALARPLGSTMASSLRRTWSVPLTLVPVPAAPSRERYRGVNPAGLLARRLSLETGWELRAEALRCLGDPAPRKGLNRRERILDQSAQFVAREPVRGPVLLVDDVVTTGETLIRCARALERAGCPEVRALALARAA